MKIFERINLVNEDLHHAYAIEGERGGVVSELVAFLEERFKIITRSNPDFRYEEHATFGIDEARALNLAQMKKSITAGRKFFVISFESITVEAQNALLKVFEEPAQNTHFFLILNSFENLLPTLRSRLFLLSAKSENKKTKWQKGEEFLSSSIAERLKIAEEISESKNRAGVSEILNGLEYYLSDKFRNGSQSAKEALTEVYKVRKYAEDRSASIKLLLEHLCVCVPEIKI